MFKLSIAAAIGLSAVVSAAHADTIVVQQGYPGIAPIIVSPTHAPTHGTSAYNTPSFERLVEMGARFGFECGVPDLADGPHPYLSPEAQADADKRLAQYQEEWEERAEEAEELVEVLPAPVPVPTHPRELFAPGQLFGWNAPHPLPRTLTVPRVNPYQFGHRFPTLPRVTAPRNQVPYGYANPHAFTLPRGTYPRGPIFPWPTL